MNPRSGDSPLTAWRGASAGPFPVITLALLIVIGLASFLVASYLQIFDDGSGKPRTTAANTFSRSAIGHLALAETLRKLGIPVEISRFNTLAKAGPNNLLLLIEPELNGPGKAMLRHLDAAPHTLLVLPKWAGRTDREKPIWIDQMEERPVEEPSAVLDSVLPAAWVVRLRGPGTIHADQYGGTLKLNDPQYFSGGAGKMVSLLDATGGTLLGRVSEGGRELWILSDPDLLSNFGIDDADNGVIAVAIIEALLPKGGTVVIDETAHGFEQRPNLMRVLLHPPFVTVIIAGFAALVLLVWAGTIRFGAAQAEATGLAPGKLTLVRNAAQLLRLGTTSGNLLQSYRRLAIAGAFAELHGPAGLDEAAQAAWLDRAAQRRGLSATIGPLLERIGALSDAGRIDAGKALGLAHDLHRWKQEILDGTVAPGNGATGTGGSRQRPGPGPGRGTGGAAQRG